MRGGGGRWHFYHLCLYINSKVIYIQQYYYIAICRKCNFKHATLNHAVHYATLQNIELTIYQETIQLAQIKIKFFQECTYNTDKY